MNSSLRMETDSHNIARILDNLQLITEYHAELQFESYIYIQNKIKYVGYFKDSIDLLIAILSFITYEFPDIRILSLIAGIILIIKKTFEQKYKEIDKIKKQEQHWYSSNNFSNLANDLESHSMLIKSSMETQTNPVQFILEYNEQIKTMKSSKETYPEIPSAITKKYKIKKTTGKGKFNPVIPSPSSSASTSPSSINKRASMLIPVSIGSKIVAMESPLPTHQTASDIDVDTETGDNASNNEDNTSPTLTTQTDNMGENEEIEMTPALSSLKKHKHKRQNHNHNIHELIPMDTADEENMRNFIDSVRNNSTKTRPRKKTTNLIDIP